jgi:hypothetical protein
MCGRQQLFVYVPPPLGESLADKGDRIQSYIAEINTRLLNGLRNGPPKGAQFMVVAGTKEKCHALRALLNHQEYKVSYLCTEQGAATEIIHGRA